MRRPYSNLRRAFIAESSTKMNLSKSEIVSQKGMMLYNSFSRTLDSLICINIWTLSLSLMIWWKMMSYCSRPLKKFQEAWLCKIPAFLCLMSSLRCIKQNLPAGLNLKDSIALNLGLQQFWSRIYGQTFTTTKQRVVDSTTISSTCLTPMRCKKALNVISSLNFSHSQKCG